MPFGEITLNDGHRIPAIAFGSWKIPKEVTAYQVGQAVDVGFDHIDTAQGRSSDRSFFTSTKILTTRIVYYNEEEVGQAIKESGLSRNELWVTTKWSGIDEKGARQSIGESLEKLGLEYLDLYLIHSPRVTKGDIKGAWKELEALQKEGKTKSIGVSKQVHQRCQTIWLSLTSGIASTRNSFKSFWLTLQSSRSLTRSFSTLMSSLKLHRCLNTSKSRISFLKVIQP